MAEQRELRDDEIESIKQYQDDLAKLQQEKLDIYRQAMTVELIAIGDEVNNMTQEQAAQHLSNIQAQYDQLNQAADDNYTAQLNQLYSYYQSRGMLDSEEYAAAREEARKQHDQDLAENRQFLTDGLTMLGEASVQWVAKDAEKWNAVVANTNTSRAAYSDALSQINFDTADAFFDMYNATVQGGGQVTEEQKKIAATMLAAFDGLSPKMEEDGKAALMGMLTGMESQIPGLENMADMSVQEIVDTMRSGLGISGGASQITTSMGKNTADGIIEGITERREAVRESGEAMASTVTESIASESEEPEKIGAEYAENLEEGIESKKSSVKTTAKETASTVTEGLDSENDKPKKIGKEMSSELMAGLEQMRASIEKTADRIASTIVSAIKSAVNEMNGVGVNMVEGVESGMQSKKSWIGSRISSFASSLVSSFKNAFDINSPSKIMRDIIGAGIVEGIGVGIEENADEAIDPMEALKDDLTAFDGLSVEKSINVKGSAQTGIQRLTAEINDLKVLVSQYLPEIAGNSTKNIYLDKRRLVGELAPDMDEALGDIASRRAVGAV